MKQIQLDYALLALVIIIAGAMVGYWYVTQATPPLPGDLGIVALSTSPSSVFKGDSVTISVDVKNVGDTELYGAVTLVLNGAVERTLTETLAGNEEKTVTFTVIKGVGNYDVTLQGSALTDTFTVKKRPKVVVAFDVGGRGDKSFNDMAYFGAQKAQAEFGYEISTITPLSLAEMENVLRALSESGDYEIILCIGFLWGDALDLTSRDYPDQLYAGVDCYLPENENVLSIVFNEEQGCALVGAIAGLITESNEVGIVLGMEISLLWKFEIGYKLGVEYAENVTGKDINVQWDYTGYFDRPDLGRESTITMLDAGADVIFQAAGETGLGVLDAVAERGVPNTLPFVIGVDANQDWVKPGQVIVSMRKMVDVGTYTALKQVAEGTFEGGVLSLGIPEGGIGLSDLEDLDEWLSDPILGPIIIEETGGMSLSDVRDAVAAMRETWETVDGYNVWDIAEELKQKILAGEIVVPVPFTADDIAYYRGRYG